MNFKIRSDEQKQKWNTSTVRTLLFLAILVVLAISFLILGGGAAYKSTAENQTQIAENVQILKDLEAKTPSIGLNNGPVKITNLQAEQDKVLSIPMEGFNKDQLRGWFQNSIILGDSITAAIKEYGFLGDDIVFAKVGGSLNNGAEQFEKAKARFPSTVFLCYGSNDLSNFMSNSSAFIQKYDAYINELKAVNPNVVCYINAVFPLQPKAWGGDPGGPYQPDYNAALSQYCEQKENVYYIDSCFILERMPELYESDGVHPVVAFYPKWLTYLADLSGLSNETN